MMRRGVLLLAALAGLASRSSLPAQDPPVKREKPALMSGVSDMQRVKEVQRAWAEYLGVPVEDKVDLGGGVKLELVLIPPGKFSMGSPEKEDGRATHEGPQHTVTLTKAFYLGKYEVTQQQWERVMGSNPSWFSPAGGGKDAVKGLDTQKFPVERISWADAQAFVKKLSGKDRQYRLPAEAEWEYACRGGIFSRPGSPFQLGDERLDALSSDHANFDGTQPYGDASRGKFLERPAAVGTYAPNQFGLYDLHGNVQEWCQDRYGKDYYKESPPQNPQGPAEGADRVMRGGGWNSAGQNCRSAARRWLGSSWRYFDVGLRVVLVPPGQ